MLGQEAPNPAAVEREQKIEAVAKVLRPKLRPIQYDGQVEDIATVIVDESKKQGFDPFFVLSIMEWESGFNIMAKSCTNSMGLMQLQRKTWELVRVGNNIWDPIENVRSGIRVLGRIKKAGFRRPESILLAYNQGPRIAREWAHGRMEMPPEAAAYVPLVMAKYTKHLKSMGHHPSKLRQLFAWDFPPRRVLVAAK